MATPRGTFAPELLPEGWFDETLRPEGWFSQDFLEPVASGGAVTADLNATEAADALSSTATLASAGLNANLTATESADTLASTAAIAIQATLGRTEATDTLSSAAVLAIRANATLTEGQDTAAGQAVLPIQAAGSTTEAPDAASATASLAIQANFAQGEQPDTVTSTASVGAAPIVANLNATEAPDLLESAAIVETKIQGGGSSKSKRGHVIQYRFTRRLEEALEEIEDVRPAARVKANKAKIKKAIEIVRDINPPPSYAKAIDKIERSLVSVSRATAKHEGMIESLMVVAMEMQDLIARMQREKAERQRRDIEALLWLL